MKSGKGHNIHKLGVFREKDYKDAHQGRDCDGRWVPTFELNEFFPAGALGPIKVSCVPYIKCNKCKATFLAPGFQDFIEEVIASRLVLSKALLDKKQLKFLRQHFDLSQDRLSELLGVGDRFYMSKFESGNSAHQMPADVQFKLKVVYAKMLGIDSTDSIYALLEQLDSYAKITPEDLPRAQEIKKQFAFG
jgi:DNA-binding transcriptional regulator YiaG